MHTYHPRSCTKERGREIVGSMKELPGKYLAKHCLNSNSAMSESLYEKYMLVMYIPIAKTEMYES